MLLDSNGKQLSGGKLIRLDNGFPNEPLRVRYDKRRHTWLAERLPPHDPTPQNIHGLKFTIIQHKTGPKRQPIKDRFYSKIDTDDPSKCWNWQDSLDKDGYGFFFTGTRKNPVTHRAHRFSYQFHYGVEPGDKLVCHKCDNPSCVNPTHLFLGTYSDNNNDTSDKGRHRSNPRIGVDAKQSNLDENDVRRIRQLYAKGGISQTELAEAYGVSQVAISCIVRRKTWTHID